LKYTAIIIDDEPKLREVLSIKLGKYCPDIKIIAKAGNAQEGYEAIQELRPNLVFLDISMPGESGLEMLTRFDEVNFECILVTGYNELRSESNGFTESHYLLKPVKTEDLINAVNKSIEIIAAKMNPIQ
jgi:two-component system, LytTR family, response regulator